MDIELTKGAKRSLALLYTEYKQRISEGMNKRQAVSFDPCPEEIAEDKQELKLAGFIKAYILGDIELTDKAIVYMESKPIETIKEWLSLAAPFVPLIFQK